METRGLVFLVIVVGLFGVMSAVLGFMAESKSSPLFDELLDVLLQPADIHVSGTDCVYPASPSYSLAVGAILLLLFSQIIASGISSCCGCCRRRPQDGGGGASKKSNKQVAGIIVSVVSWIAAVIAAVYYWIGASWNEDQTRSATVAGRVEECFYLKDGVFTRAAVLSLVATLLALMSCKLLRAPAAADEQVAGRESGVAVGLPQWPAQGYGQAPYQQPAQAPYGNGR